MVTQVYKSPSDTSRTVPPAPARTVICVETGVWREPWLGEGPLCEHDTADRHEGIDESQCPCSVVALPGWEERSSRSDLLEPWMRS